jgi:hypothetical protein
VFCERSAEGGDAVGADGLVPEIVRDPELLRPVGDGGGGLVPYWGLISLGSMGTWWPCSVSACSMGAAVAMMSDMRWGLFSGFSSVGCSEEAVKIKRTISGSFRAVIHRMEGEVKHVRSSRRRLGLSSKRTKIVPFQQKSVASPPKSASIIDVSASSGSRWPAMDPDVLRVEVRRIVMYGTIWETKHSAVDRGYRNISQDDILAVLDGDWTLAAAPDWDEAHRNWEYKVAGQDVEGDELVLKIAVNSEMQRIDIITKY